MNAAEDRVLYARLMDAIGADGAGTETTDGVVLTAVGGRRLPWPMRLRITPDSFGRVLRDAAADSAGAFPDVEPLEAAWRLFLVHLDEAIKTARPNETELLPTTTGIASLRADMTRAPITPEQEENREDQQRYDRLIEHFTESGRVEVEWEAHTLVLRERDGRLLARPVRVRLPYRATTARLRRDGAPDAEWAVLVSELTAKIDAGATDIELRENGSMHVRE
ncbi:hypothetical protein [Actinomycetospora sp. TBRC 11914]|uniref:hypothetical protein n=1 Tax=Actinomycetospora sp. TBRC 11914 TaxID=2729387 RepID=UPI00145E521A|nr:hypothetical protein [Actinomycetospora sp. TBRC 11914]NMO93204.1 hypothetical protein [Actinomycetospora sp. TBRC 11914]